MEGAYTVCGVAVTGGVGEEGVRPIAVLFAPVVFERRALTPFAVLFLPVVLKRRALTPFAVLKLPVVFDWRAS